MNNEEKKKDEKTGTFAVKHDREKALKDEVEKKKNLSDFDIRREWEKPSISHSIDSSYNNININLGSRKREIKTLDKNSAKALTQLQKTARTIIKFTVPQKATSPARTTAD